MVIPLQAAPGQWAYAHDAIFISDVRRYAEQLFAASDAAAEAAEAGELLVSPVVSWFPTAAYSTFASRFRNSSVSFRPVICLPNVFS